MFHFSNFPPPKHQLASSYTNSFSAFLKFRETPFSTATTFNLQGVTLIARMLSSKASSLCKSNAVRQLLNTRLVLFVSFSAMDSVSEEVEVFLRNEKVDAPWDVKDMATGRCTCYICYILLRNWILFIYRSTSNHILLLGKHPPFCWSRRWSCFNKYLLVVGCFFHKSPFTAVASQVFLDVFFGMLLSHLWNLRVPQMSCHLGLLLGSAQEVSPPTGCLFHICKKRHRHRCRHVL